MKLADAVAAGQIAAQIAYETKILAAIDLAISEQWPVSTLKVSAPKGSVQAEGTELDLLGSASLPIAELWKIAITQARTAHQTVLEELNAQLAGL